MFGFVYEKTSSAIIEKATAKATSLKAKIEERQAQIAALRKEHGIDDAALVQLLTAARQQQRNAAVNYSYTSNAAAGGGAKMEERTIGAGVVNHLLTENDFIETDKESVKKLELVVRNLRPLTRYANNGTAYTVDEFRLSDEEIRFLGF